MSFARNVQGKVTAPIKKPTAITFGVRTPAAANTPTLMTPVTTEIAASVAITAAPSRPVAISTDNMITPAPVVPPIRRPQPAAPTKKPFSPRCKPRRLSSRRSGTDLGRHQHRQHDHPGAGSAAHQEAPAGGTDEEALFTEVQTAPLE